MCAYCVRKPALATCLFHFAKEDHMSQSVFGASAAVTMLNRAFNNSSPAAAVFNNQVQTAGSTTEGQYAFARQFGASFDSLSDADLASRVMGNMGMLPNDALLSAFTDYLAANNKADRGVIVLQLGQILATMENATGDLAIYAPQALAWNKEVENSFVYSSNSANTTAFNGDFPDGGTNPGQTFTLTAGADSIPGTGGDDTINALTVNSTGATAETFSAFDSIDGGAGTDTLNIFTTATENEAFPASGSVKNVEIVNVYNGAAAAALGDASKFAGVVQLWQHVAAADVSNLAATTTAGFKGVEATVAADVDVSAAATATTAAIALDGVKGAAATGAGETINRADIDVDGAALTGVTVTGTLAQKTTTAGSAAATLALNVTLAKDAQAGTVNSAVATILTIDNAGGSTKDLTSVDASASAGAITYTTADNKVASIKTGTGKDSIQVITATLKDDTATASVDETISAVVDSGAGNDDITINTTGTGTTTVNAGEGDDAVTLTGRGDGKLTVNLGAGNDTFKGAGAVAATDAIDAGEGTDTLLLSMVGAANIGAFSNFETFDAVGMNKTLDVEILAAKNTVTEFVMSGDNGGTAALTNIGAGVGFRVTGDTTVANVTTLTQKTAGALTITLDIDETGTTAATTAATDRDVTVTASNATSIKAVFDSAFVAAATGAGDNATDLNITGTAATTLEVVSGGANALNELDYTTASASGKSVLTSVTVSGDRALDLDLAITGGGTNEVATINASALTGALTFALDDLKAAGTLTLGSGDDVITVQTGVAVDVATIIAAHRKISGVEKGSAEDLTAISNYDTFKLTGAIQAVDDTTGTADASVKDGKITFKGTGPATLDQAVTFAQALIDLNEAAVFEYVGKSYIFAEGGTDGTGADVLIELTGVTGLNGLDVVNATAGTLYVF
jgi:hypothetical protein